VAEPDWRVLPWSEIELIAAVILKETTMKTFEMKVGPTITDRLIKTGIMLATGIPMPSKRTKMVKTKVESTDVFYLLDIFLKQPPLRIRIPPKSIDFKFLGSKMGVSSQENFKILLKELVAGAPSAMVSEGARFLMNPNSASGSGYDSETDFGNECRWLVTLKRLKG